MSRILFTSPVQPIGGSTPNVYNWDKPPSLVKLTMSFINHPGLCFLKAGKQLMHSESVKALKILSRNNMVVQGFYIIGFEEDTIDSIKANINELSTLDLDIIQVQVLTPYPQTALESQIKEKYGPLNNNLSKYNSRNLVWNHPNISIEDMRSLQKWANKKLFTISQTVRAVQKVLVYDCTRQVSVNGLKRLVMSYKSARLYYQEQ